MNEGLSSLSEVILEAAYRAEFVETQLSSAAYISVGTQSIRVGELRAWAMIDLATRIERHAILRRADDTTRHAALRFVERRLTEGNKIQAFEQSGSFRGFLQRVLRNLLLDWVRSPTGKAESRRLEYQPEEEEHVEEWVTPREDFDRRRCMILHALVALRLLQRQPPGRRVPLQLALWPSLEFDLAEVRQIASFAYCHETANLAAESRACDAGRRCPAPSEGWLRSFQEELEQAQQKEPAGLSRRTIAELTRIGREKTIAKREGALCERISKGRLQLLEELRHVGIRGIR